jgi:hypothetical protein
MAFSFEEYARTCDEVLSTIEEYKSTATAQLISEDILKEKHKAHLGKGQTLPRNDPVCAIEHFEKGRGVLLQMGCSCYDILMLEANILIKSKKLKLLDHTRNKALKSILRQQKRLREIFKAEAGEDHSSSLGRGLNLAKTLMVMEQFSQARDLLESLYKISCRAHGPDHGNTKCIEKMMIKVVMQCQSIENFKTIEKAWLLPCLNGNGNL